MKNKTNIIILIILITGILYRLILTSGGNFIFNMDNGRDMVDVREMVVLQKMRLTGPTSAIDGFFNGPFWYYLLAVPYIITNGDPYGSIVMEMVLWAIGGFFLLKLVSRWGIWLMAPVGLLWIASNYIVLASFYAFNPNPVTFLAPLFVYLLVKYLENVSAVYVILVWLLGGLFFNFEMNFGVFVPLIIVISILITRNEKFLGKKAFWIGVFGFVLLLLPQVIFDLRHQFIMSQAVLRHLTENIGSNPNIYERVQSVSTSFFNVFTATLINQKILALLILGLFVLRLFIGFWKKEKKELLPTVCLIFILTPFLGYLVLPVAVNPWHLGAETAVSLILIGYLLNYLMRKGLLAKISATIISAVIILLSLENIGNFFFKDMKSPNLDPSLFKNEIAAIDYVYKYANGRNFKAYVYLPSVIDYPYQYLFWWYGNKKYGFIPGEYAYSPNKPQYISNKEKFEGRQDNFSGIVFLIKEPDRINLRQAWENDFEAMEFISKDMIGPLEIEVRKEKLF